MKDWQKLNLNGERFAAMRAEAARIAAQIGHPKLRRMFTDCFFNTISTTVRFLDDGTAFVLTGDIPAMWLRDSSAQVMQYVRFADRDEDVRKLIKGLAQRQFHYILIDAYANSFNAASDNAGHVGDECWKSPWVWERKFELDSLCYPVLLANRYYETTGDAEIFAGNFAAAARRILEVFEIERDHAARSDYYHYRPGEPPALSVPNRGRGTPTAVNGLIWSGYRPSDDPCAYGYFIPGNFFCARILRLLRDNLSALGDGAAAARAAELGRGVEAGLAACATTCHERFGTIYVYETDGLGHYNLMDDANVPSLLGLPYLGCVAADDPVYLNTRRFVLSEANPYYFAGSALRGVGSPHTPAGYVWPIALVVEALTCVDAAEINSLLGMLVDADAGTGYMHEGADCCDPSRYSRPWFAWANSMFAYLVLEKWDAIRSDKKWGIV